MDTRISNLNDRPLLSGTDRSFLGQAQAFFDDLQLGMSAFKIRSFVLNDESFPLPDSKYHQAKLELYSRWQKILDLELDFRKNRAQQKLLAAQRMKWQAALDAEAAFERLEAEAQIELLAVEAERHQTAESFLHKNCAETLREMRVFLEVVEELRSELRYETREASEPAHWTAVQAIREQQPGVAVEQLPFRRFLKGSAARSRPAEAMRHRPPGKPHDPESEGMP